MKPVPMKFARGFLCSLLGFSLNPILLSDAEGARARTSIGQKLHGARSNLGKSRVGRKLKGGVKRLREVRGSAARKLTRVSGGNLSEKQLGKKRELTEAQKRRRDRNLDKRIKNETRTINAANRRRGLLDARRQTSIAERLPNSSS